MGKRGPKPTPTALKRLEGNPGKRKLPKGEPEPAPLELAGVDPPAHLSKLAKQEWSRLAPELLRMGLLTVVDLGMLAVWCAAFADFITAERALAKGGLVTNGKDDHPVRSPWFMVKYKAMETMAKMAPHFGFSPSARVALATAPELPNAAQAPTHGKGLAGYLDQNPDRLN